MVDAGQELTDKKLEELEQEIADEYRKANREIQAKLNGYMKHFEAEDEIMRERLKNGEISKKEYFDWRYRKIMNKRQWENMRDSLAADYHNANAIAMSISNGYRPEVYAINHNFAAYQFEHDFQIDTSYTLYNTEAVERLLRENPELLPPPKPGGETARKLAENKDLIWNRQKVQSAVLQGILQGDSVGEIAKRLQQVTDMNHHAALRNARTMMTGAQNAGRNDCYDRIESKGAELDRIWISSLDMRVRHSHRQMHGQVREGKIFSNGLEYPGDPSGEPAEVYNCRCSMRCFMKGYKGIPKHSPKMGTLSFEDWLEAKPSLPSGEKNGRIKSRSGSRQAREKKENISKIEKAAPKPKENTEVVSGLKPISGNHTRKQDIQAVNPNWKSGSFEWTNNCQRCVTTYEARRRGYDVTVLPCYSERDKLGLGKGYTLPYDKGDRKADTLWHISGLQFSEARSFTNEQCMAAIINQMNEYGNGSRAIIDGFWKDGRRGHVFIAENVGGKVQFFDPQNGDMNCARYIDEMSPISLSMFRIDDLPFTSVISEVFRNDIE